ncbi:MAG: hypothetical protein NC243_11265 [Lachnoclostridium sp.]|nr:hypothetical protein [Lachnoclostridium sp.]MCM1385107.1 hypothetical protein [Lachnoclostridium sp.]
MANPLFQALGGKMGGMGGNNPFKIVEDFIQFKKTFQGDPKQKVQELLRNGQLTQEQLNQVQGMAGQFQSLLSQFPK